jgi:hypothetical protein
MQRRVEKSNSRLFVVGSLSNSRYGRVLAKKISARGVNRRWLTNDDLARLSDRRQVIRLPRMDDGSLQIAYVAYFLRRVSTHMITEDDRFGFEVTCILSIKKPFYSHGTVPEDIRTRYRIHVRSEANNTERNMDAVRRSARLVTTGYQHKF